MFASAKGKQQQQLHCQAQCISHTHITFRDCRVHNFSDNLSRNSCIYRFLKKAHFGQRPPHGRPIFSVGL